MLDDRLVNQLGFLDRLARCRVKDLFFYLRVSLQGQANFQAELFFFRGGLELIVLLKKTLKLAMVLFEEIDCRTCLHTCLLAFVPVALVGTGLVRFGGHPELLSVTVRVKAGPANKAEPAHSSG